MICPSCAKANVDGLSFCEFCGASMRSVAYAGMPGTAPAAAVAQPTPSAADVAKIGKSLLATLSVGEKFVGAGAIAAALGFFLPFISSPDLGELGGLLSNLNPNADVSHASISMFAIAKLLGVIYFVLLAAIGSGVLFYLARSAAAGKKLLISGFQVMIGSLFGPLFLVALFFVPGIQKVAGSGYWLLALGFCAIAAGGLISISQLARQTR